MKRAFKIMMIAVAAMATFSCAKEINNPVETEQPEEVNPEVVAKEGFKLIADVDSDLTKTSLSGTSILWDDSDAVKAYGDYTYTSTGITRSNENKTAEFTFGPLEDGDDVLFALYPAANAGGADYENMEITIPTEQVATINSFDPAAMAAIGAIDGDYKIAFKNVGALLSIVINNDDIASVELSATEESGESMTGTAAIEMDGSGNITTLTDGSSTSVKLTGGLSNGETYYFVVYPGTYSNLKIVVTRSSDGYTATYRNATPFTVARNENWRIANLTIAGGKWVNPNPDPEVFEELDLTTASVGCSSYNTSTTYGDWVIVNGANNNKGWEFYKMGGSSTYIGDNNPCYIYSSNSYDGVTKVAVNILDGSLPKSGMSVNSWGVYVYSDSSLETQIDYVAGGTITNNDGKVFYFTPTSGTSWPDGSYFKVSWNLANTSSTNGIIWVDNISLYHIPGAVAASYSVTYNANGGDGDIPVDSNTYTDNVFTATAASSTLTRSGYNFTGWNTAADGSGRSYAEGATFVVTSNVTLYAQWEAIVYTITKNINAHCTYTVKAGGVEVTEATIGTSLTLEADTPDLGYTFNKFHIDYTKPDSTPGENNFTVNPKPYTMPASNITITLVLNEVDTYTVTWKVGESTYQTDVLTAGDVLALPTNPVPAEVGYDGKVFMGWTTAATVNADGSSITYAANDDAVTADVEYHAVFAVGSSTPASLAEVSSSYTLTVDDELVIVANDGSADYGLYEETTNSSYVKNFEFTNSASDIAGNAKKHWTVSKVSDNYYLGDSTNGYLYTSSSNNLASNTSSKSPITLAYDSTEGKFTIVMNNRWLSLRSDLTGSNKNLWRMGGQTSGSPNGVAYFTIYKYTPASGSFSDYTL